MSFKSFSLFACSVLFTVMTVGCERQPAPVTVQSDPQPLPLDQRVVSLSPTLTKMVMDLGFAQTLVATGRDDPAAPEGLPTVEDEKGLNPQTLQSLEPTHVLAIAGPQGPPKALTDLAAKSRFELLVYPQPRRVSEIARILFDEQQYYAKDKTPESVRCLGSVFDAWLIALDVTTRMSMQLGMLNQIIDSASKPKVLLVTGTEPITVSGPGSLLDHLLSFAGGRNAAMSSPSTAPSYTPEELAEIKPEIVLIVQPTANPYASVEDPRLADLRQVAGQRAALINDPLLQTPSGAPAKIAATIAKQIHPDLAEKIDQAMAQNASLLSPLLTEPVSSNDEPVNTGLD